MKRRCCLNSFRLVILCIYSIVGIINGISIDGVHSGDTESVTMQTNNGQPGFEFEGNNGIDIIDNGNSNKSQSLGQKDNFFSVDKSIFEEVLQDANLAFIPGLLHDDDFENWTPPEGLQRDMPMYMSGFDRDNRPIWILELGKYKFGKYIKQGPKEQAMLRKYFRYQAYIVLKSHALKRSKENRVDKGNLIMDLEGLKLELWNDPQILHFLLRIVRDFRPYMEKNVYKVVVLNVGQVSEALLSLTRFFSAKVIRTEVYGPNKAFWAPQLLKSFPKDQLPEWYGGSRNFQPFYVLG